MSLEEEMDLRLFKNNKKALKTRLTRFTKYIDSIDGTSNIQTNKLDLRLANITPVLDLFYEVQGKIEVGLLLQLKLMNLKTLKLRHLRILTLNILVKAKPY